MVHLSHALIALVVLFFSDMVRADNLSAAFDQANRLYEEGKYEEAARAYGKLAQGHASSALYFNLGNALLKSGELGRAIVYYRLAQQLAPRDDAIRANLHAARLKANSGTANPAPWLFWIRSLNLNELTIVSAIAWWITFTLLAARQIWPAGAAFRKASLGSGAAAILLALWLAALWYDEVGSHPAVVVTKEAVARLGPFEESQSAFVLPDGTEVKVRAQKTGWLEIQDAAGRSGWVQQDQLSLLNPS